MTKIFAGQKKPGPKFKFGIRVPRSVREAYKLDEINGDTLCFTSPHVIPNDVEESDKTNNVPTESEGESDKRRQQQEKAPTTTEANFMVNFCSQTQMAPLLLVACGPSSSLQLPLTKLSC